MAQTEEINAVKFVQGQTTDWYLLSTNPEVTFTDHNPVISGKTYDLANGNIETEFGTAPTDLWYTVRTDGTAGNWNTICLERNITAIDGATFWTVSGQTDTEFIIDQITEPQAGQGYIIRFTADELKVKYGDQVAAEPVTASYGNPIQGTYVQIDPNETGESVLTNNYIIYENQLRKVGKWVGLRAKRAYLVADCVPNGVVAPVPGRQRLYMPKPKETPTELKLVHDARCTMHDGKYLINGQFVIVKDTKMFNAQGMKL